MEALTSETVIGLLDRRSEVILGPPADIVSDSFSAEQNALVPAHEVRGQLLDQLGERQTALEDRLASGSFHAGSDVESYRRIA